MSTISVDYDVLNQKGSPAWFSDTFANIPTAGYKGRMFISIDTYAFYRDTGTGWDLIGGPGTGTLTGSGTTGQVSFFNGTQTITGNNNLFWDNTNSRLGINTATPGAPLDIHGTGTQLQLNGTGANNSYLVFQNTGASKWRIGNLSPANSFEIYNAATSTYALTIASATNEVVIQQKLTIGGQVSFGSTLTNNTYTYTLPSATGTLALTSNLSSYLPLAGGTLTGALIGTSAAFTGDLTIDTNTLFVDSTNNRIGIGTSSPSYLLHAYSTDASTARIYLQGTSNFVATQFGNTGGAFYLGIDDSAGVNFTGSAYGRFLYSTGAYPLVIATNSTERMRITSAGNVGIGITAPADLLSISAASPSMSLRYTSAGSSATPNESIIYFRDYNGSGTIRGGIHFQDQSASTSQTNLLFKVMTSGNVIITGIKIVGDGNVYNYNNSTLWSITSDIRVKENINTLDNAINLLNKLNPVIFDYKDFYLKEKNWDINKKNNNIGFIAQEYEKVFPNSISKSTQIIDGNEFEDFRTLDTSSLIPYLVKAIQELNKKLIKNNIN